MASFLAEERRRAPRYQLVAPVQLNGASIGHTLDMSTQGVLFGTERLFALGETICFSVVLSDSTIQCRGTVVRIEPLQGHFAMALELDRYEFV